jgi:hypothetical protein
VVDIERCLRELADAVIFIDYLDDGGSSLL